VAKQSKNSNQISIWAVYDSYCHLQKSIGQNG